MSVQFSSTPADASTHVDPSLSSYLSEDIRWHDALSSPQPPQLQVPNHDPYLTQSHLYILNPKTKQRTHCLKCPNYGLNTHFLEQCFFLVKQLNVPSRSHLPLPVGIPLPLCFVLMQHWSVMECKFSKWRVS